jgi:hypothetical protein
MKDENKFLINNEQSDRDEQKQSIAESEQSIYRIDNVARKFKFQCRMMLLMFVFATAVSICLGIMFSLEVINNYNLTADNESVSNNIMEMNKK